LNNSFHGTLAGVIEITMNRVLPLDPGYKDKLAKLSGRVIAISLTDLKVELFFLPDDYQFTVLSDFSGIPNVKLSGTSRDFFHMSINKYAANADDEFDSHIHFEGDVVTGQRFEKLFAELDVDWEEALADVMGDVFAHQAANIVRHAGNWFKEAFSNSQENLTEYMQQELKLTPAKIELENFYTDIATLTTDSEQLITRFESNLTHKVKADDLSGDQSS